jgi:hypothetical protein
MNDSDTQPTNTLPGMIFGGFVFATLISIGFILPPPIGLAVSTERCPRPYPVLAPLGQAGSAATSPAAPIAEAVAPAEEAAAPGADPVAEDPAADH